MNICKLFSICFVAIISTVSIAAESTFIGAGATFPYPIYKKWFDTYQGKKDIEVHYLPVGSGKGYYQLKNETVDFAGSDIFLNDVLMDGLPRDVLHIPTCIGAVGVAYNLPGGPDLRLDSGVLAEIFLGEITKWNDPKIQALNPDITLPDLHIVVVHRSDVSGTTYVFSQFLTKTNELWESERGTGGQFEWSVGLGMKGNNGVSEIIQQVSGSIGYLELVHALTNNLSVAALKNNSGYYIVPSLDSVSEAGNKSDIDDDDLRTILVDTDAQKGYPISAYTWIILYKDQSYGTRTREHAEDLASLLKWMIDDGQSLATETGYGPLPPNIRKHATKLLDSMTFNGETL